MLPLNIPGACHAASGLVFVFDRSTIALPMLAQWRTIVNKPSHHQRAEALAAAAFALPSSEDIQVHKQVTLVVPLGLLAAAEEIGSYLPRPSRAGGMVELLRLGFGFFVEKLPEDQRAAFLSRVDDRLAPLWEAHVDQGEVEPC
jgi:hypothetical protein